MENIDKIWARGTPLSEVFDRFRLIEEEKPTPTYSYPSGIRPSADSLIERIKTKAIAALRRALASEDIRAFGIRGFDIEKALEQIPSHFWAKANVRVSDDSAWQPGWSYSEITVIDAKSADGTTSSNRNHSAVASNPDKYPKTAGAISYEDERKQAIIGCFEKFPDFEKWSYPQKRDEIRRMAKHLYPDRIWKRGFGRTSLFDTIKLLKETGRLPSGNVR